MNVLMFSGQGSQYFRMGEALYRGNPLFRGHLDRLDEHAAALIGTSVVAHIYDEASATGNPICDIALANPAIFMVELALARTLIDSGVPVAMTLGASLGAFAALTIAGMLDDEDALGAVVQMARDAQSIAPKGGMIAIIAPLTAYDDQFLRDNSEVAAINFDSHFVISVDGDRIDDVENHLGARGILFQRLPVNYAFHSRWIDGLETHAKVALASLPLRPATIPFACCAHARTFTRLPADYVWTLLRRPILFRDTVRNLEAAGDYTYIDVGPSSTLATFVGYLLPHARARVSKIMDPFGNDEANLSAILFRHGQRARPTAGA